MYCWLLLRWLLVSRRKPWWGVRRERIRCRTGANERCRERNKCTVRPSFRPSSAPQKSPWHLPKPITHRDVESATFANVTAPRKGVERARRHRRLSGDIGHFRIEAASFVPKIPIPADLCKYLTRFCHRGDVCRFPVCAIRLPELGDIEHFHILIVSHGRPWIAPIELKFWSKITIRWPLHGLAPFRSTFDGSLRRGGNFRFDPATDWHTAPVIWIPLSKWNGLIAVRITNGNRKHDRKKHRRVLIGRVSGIVCCTTRNVFLFRFAIYAENTFSVRLCRQESGVG